MCNRHPLSFENQTIAFKSYKLTFIIKLSLQNIILFPFLYILKHFGNRMQMNAEVFKEQFADINYPTPLEIH